MKLYLQFFCIWVFLWDTETLWAKYEISLYWGSCFKSLLPELCFFIIILVFFLNQQCVTPECSRKKVNCCETMSWLQSGPSSGPSVGGVGRAKWLIEQTCHNLLSFLFCQLIMKSQCDISGSPTAAFWYRLQHSRADRQDRNTLSDVGTASHETSNERSLSSMTSLQTDV